MALKKKNIKGFLTGYIPLDRTAQKLDVSSNDIYKSSTQKKKQPTTLIDFLSCVEISVDGDT